MNFHSQPHDLGSIPVPKEKKKRKPEENSTPSSKKMSAPIVQLLPPPPKVSKNQHQTDENTNLRNILSKFLNFGSYPDGIRSNLNTFSRKIRNFFEKTSNFEYVVSLNYQNDTKILALKMELGQILTNFSILSI
jgi:hypothetical protein